ncbi:MAG: radical SAM protein [Candidatus Ozemobacteraceae bacterium]
MTFPYEGSFIRPPAEAESIILQATVGCAHHGCMFCGAYRDVYYRVRSAEEFRRHCSWVARQQGRKGRRVFFGDADVMALPTDELLERIEQTREAFPEASRFALYAGPRGILEKSDEELKRLKAAGFNTFYLGLETGSDPILASMEKGVTADEMTQAVERAQNAGLRASVMVLLGLGGRSGSTEHIRATAEVLNRMQPRLVSALTLMLVPGTRLWKRASAGSFTELGPPEFLDELYRLIESLDLHRSVFSANHASSFYAVEGALPRDKDRLLQDIDAARRGHRRLTPDLMRGL